MEDYQENNQNISDNQNMNNNQKSNDNTSAITSMILGIISVILCWVPIIGLVLAIISLVFAVKGLKKSKITNKGRGFSIAGISCGVAGIVLNVVYTIVWIFMGFIMKYTYDIIDNEIDDYNLYDYNSSYNRTYNYEYNSILDDYNI